MELSYNSLSGIIPTAIGQLVSLTELALGVNKFNGKIPTEMGALVNLVGLYLSSNSLSGVVPETLCALLGNLNYFYFLDTNLQCYPNCFAGKSAPSDFKPIGNVCPDPTSIPSREPSLDPTVAPSAPSSTPTAKPTFAQTTSAVPTYLDSSFALELEGVTSFGDSEKAAFSSAAATTLGVCSTCVVVDGVDLTNVVIPSTDSRLSAEIQETPKAKVKFHVKSTLPAGAGATAVLNLYNGLTTTLTKALTSGSFITQLTIAATAAGSTALATVAASSSGLASTGYVRSVVTSSPVVQGNGKSKKSKDGKTKVPKFDKKASKNPAAQVGKGKTAGQPKPSKPAPNQKHARLSKVPTVPKAGGNKHGGGKKTR